VEYVTVRSEHFTLHGDPAEEQNLKDALACFECKIRHTYQGGDHVILVGGSRAGTRIAHTLYARLAGEQMIPALTGLLTAIRDRANGRPAGEFLNETDPEQLRSWVGVADEA